MTDRELLELAAKAAGYDTSHPVNAERLLLDRPVASLWVRDDSGLCKTAWNPLLDNADAFTLAVKLGLDLLRTERDIEAIAGLPPYASMKRDVPAPFGIELLGDDPCAATRRAIVRVAAEIGRGMP